MARLRSWYGLAAAAALATLLGCENTGTPCKKRGTTETCMCSDGSSGSRQCLPERVWDACDCSTGPDGGTGSGGMTMGSGGTSSPGGQASGGTTGSGGAGKMAPNTPDKDGGGGAGSDAMIGSGGAGGTDGGDGTGSDAGGMDGSGGAVAPADNAYGKCMDASDCKVANSTCNVVAGVPPLTEDSSVCQPPCQNASDCPKPAGNYQAVLGCAEGHCGFDCSPTDLLGEDLSCPAGLTCTASLLDTSVCLIQ